MSKYITRKEFDQVVDKIQELDDWKNNEAELISCKKCKCLITKEDAICVEKKPTRFHEIDLNRVAYCSPVLTTRSYYCHNCKPNYDYIKYDLQKSYYYKKGKVNLDCEVDEEGNEIKLKEKE